MGKATPTDLSMVSVGWQEQAAGFCLARRSFEGAIREDYSQVHGSHSPHENVRRNQKLPFPPFDVGSEEQVFRNLAITDAFLAWDETDLHDDDGLDWILLPCNKHRQFADCPVHHPDMAIDSVFGETTPAIIIGNGQSQEQLRAMHGFLTDREIAYRYS